jgi:7-cyano-7-deazaguanine reductase
VTRPSPSWVVTKKSSARGARPGRRNWATQPSSVRRLIETIENRYAGRPYRVELIFPEFTSICPLTGAPDFGTITIRYVPGERLLEQRALRDFLTGFRGREIFEEEAVNAVLDEVVASCSPIYCEVEGVFNTRGGIAARAVARHGSEP